MSTVGEGGRVAQLLLAALMRCRRAARLVGMRRGAPVVVASFAATSTSSFSCTPTCAGHHTRITEKVGEVSRRFISAVRARTRRCKAGVVVKRRERALIDAWLSIKNQKVR